MKKSITALFSLIALSSFAQFDATERMTNLSESLNKLRSARTEGAKDSTNFEFDKMIEATLNEPSVFDIDFSPLHTVGVIDSPDNLVRVVTWNVEYEDDRQQYNGYIISRSAVGKQPTVVKLNYIRDIYNPKPTEVVDENQWYGALYYQIIPYNKGSKDSYILLGWNGGGMNSNIKLIDVLSLTSKGVKFGQSIFKTKDQTLKRFYLEHSSKSVVSLKYEPQYERIIFDHLSPENPSMTGFYEYYVPDLSYDAFSLKGAKLLLEEDVIGVNDRVETIKKGTKIDPKTGEVIMEEVENEWINPTSENAIESETHVAVLPEEAIANNDKETEKNNTAKEAKGTNALDDWNKKRHHRKEKNENGVLQEPKKTKKKKR